MRKIAVMIKPASALCNIRCKYCFYADVADSRAVNSYGKMTPEIMRKMIDHLLLDLTNQDQLTITFQGGEPTLAGFTYFQSFVTYMTEKNTKKVTIQYAIQTNGLLINEKWCRFFYEHHFLVGLSIDGYQSIHDRNRIDPKSKGTFHRVIKTKQLFEKYQVQYNVLCVLTNELARHPQKMYQFMKQEKIQYIQFIPCLGDLNGVKSVYALTPQRFYHFYHVLWDLWIKEYATGNYRSIKFFDDLVHLFKAQRVTACGLIGQCQPQYVIESNGNVYPCDFYVLDQYLMGNITEYSLIELYKSYVMKHFLFEPKQFPQKCQDCPFRSMCMGGCKRMKHSMYLDKKETYCGFQTFLSQHGQELIHFCHNHPV
ncbi:radical SAM/SPASM domain-containing protein [Candidatus Enterococcus lemimoniae]|uniref:Anaerobic sulfatase maturase n=1 Tax=Candidatus Enterococcus lemimoniae TaxID=1834167 RepID=A0ABZ2T3C4_9ENTE|nr:SPASM domain-containing protein [Enterococcus sp. 12C11_DIV0727]OTO68914.1 anaerobic sulfatase maturase [Enterococcus sp. 12C11_DIV0727]